MLDIQFIRDNPELVAQKAQLKGYQVDIPALLSVDAEVKNAQAEVEQLRAERRQIAESAKGQRPSDEQIQRGKTLKDLLAPKEEALAALLVQRDTLLKKVPNMPIDDVPEGASEDENVETKTWGTIPSFDFAIQSHWQLAEKRDWIDKERAAKVTGSRFAYIKGDLVRLQFAIIQFVLDTVSDKTVIAKLINDNNLQIEPKAFEPILPPVMIREEIYDQMDRLEPREDRYHIDGDDDNLWLIGSAEHTLGSMYANEILPADALPLRYIGYSTSFRQEAGTYGKDTEGILRMHQFDKLEMEVFSTAETGLDEHKLLIAMQEHLMQTLDIPYHVLMKCTADIGKPNARGVDIEAWIPAQNKYRETHTADYMTDYQARRLQTRVRGTDDQVSLVHTNDATAFALGRAMIAIIENYQNADGTVRVPNALQPYLGGRTIL